MDRGDSAPAAQTMRDERGSWDRRCPLINEANKIALKSLDVGNEEVHWLRLMTYPKDGACIRCDLIEFSFKM